MGQAKNVENALPRKIDPIIPDEVVAASEELPPIVRRMGRGLDMNERLSVLLRNERKRCGNKHNALPLEAWIPSPHLEIRHEEIDGKITIPRTAQ